MTSPTRMPYGYGKRYFMGSREAAKHMLRKTSLQMKSQKAK